MIATVVQFVGLACIVFAGFVIYGPAGWVLLGLVLLLVGQALNGVTFPKRARPEQERA